MLHELLQWVRGPKTAVSRTPHREEGDFSSCFNGSAVRRPRLAPSKVQGWLYAERLQWVRGPKTAVSARQDAIAEKGKTASMGPRSEDRG